MIFQNPLEINFILLILDFLTCLDILLHFERRDIICEIFVMEGGQEVNKNCSIIGTLR
ncbi:unnamed protein product [Lupinus luteus]|uniref:Uncharacterized protein n=1 Tax=Lupinus luteus TaxID=3873 RepID=A0AAV1XEF2_LUPLU